MEPDIFNNTYKDIINCTSALPTEYVFKSTLNRTTTLTSALPPEWVRVLYIICISIIMAVAIIGNAVIILVEVCNKNKTSTDWLVLFMAAYDLIMSTCDIPFYIITNSGHWQVLGSTASCRFFKYVENTMSYASTLLLSVTAIDRYVKTCRPLSVGITPRRARTLCIVLSAFTLVIASPGIVNHYYDKTKKCTNAPKGRFQKVYKKVLIYTIQLSFILMFIIVTTCYCKIAFTLRRRVNRFKVKVQYFSTKRSQRKSSFLAKFQSLTYWRPNKVTPILGNNPSTHEKHNNTHVGSGSQSNKTTIAATLTTTIGATENLASMSAVNVTNNRQGPSTRPGLQNVVLQNDLKQKKMNRTTHIMLAVTLVFIFSWVPAWITRAIWPSNMADTRWKNTLIMFTRRAFILNTCTNPLFYIGMSTAFRTKIKQLLQNVRRS